MNPRWLTRVAAGIAVFAMLAPYPAAAQATNSESNGVKRLPWGAPDLQGIWSTATATPFERPPELGDKAVLTEEEAAEYARQIVDQRNADSREGAGSDQDVARAYNDFWYDRGNQFVATRRTSLVVDPPDGRVPRRTPQAQARMDEQDMRRNRVAQTWEDRNLWERCITRGMPGVMLPTGYNNHYQIFQTPDYVAIYTEMIHDVRIIPVDGREPLSPAIRQWMGNSRGRWEGDTLIVETANFSEKSAFWGAAENLKLTERFTRMNEDLMIYRLTVEDPTSFEQPWTLELPVNRIDGPLYEYACHEGNYGMFGILEGARAQEAAENGSTR